MTDRYLSVAREARVKIAVGACRFIASVSRSDSEKEARAFIETVSSEFHNATHNVFAYIIGHDDRTIFRSCDAGEPAGTAGSVILQVIKKRGLTNVTLVGTRYFGGVKLGIGGLIRAYRLCAERGLEEAGQAEAVSYIVLSVKVEYGQLGSVLREVESTCGEVKNVDYIADGVVIHCCIPTSAAEIFKSKLLDLTKGKGDISCYPAEG